MTQNKKGWVVLSSGILLSAALLFHLTKINVGKDASLLAVTVMAGYPIAKKAWQCVRIKVFSIELLVTIAVGGAVFITEYMESAAVTFLFLLGAYLEARTLEKTRSSLKSLMDMAPLNATVRRDGKSVTIRAEEVREGNLVLISSGEKIAIDGKVTSGKAFVNEAAITGESVLVRKGKNDYVFSGSIVDTGFIEVEAEKAGENTAFARIIELVEEAQEAKAKTQKFLEKFSSFYTPVIIILSIIVFLFSRDIEMSLTFLVIACPGALVISGPVSIVAGIGNGAKNGVLVKGGEIMERFSKVDVLVFDKTGTLTKGKPEVTAIQAYGMDEVELLTLAAEAEVISEHHLGQTIVKEAARRGIPFIHKPSDFAVVKGNGIQAVVQGRKLAIGNRKWMNANQIYLPNEVDNYAAFQEKSGNTAVFVAERERIVGVISIADQIRPDAFETIQKLKENGIKKVFMLTGDNRYSANKTAVLTGIDRVYAELLPEDKVTEINNLKLQGFRVAMVGDGINDAPAMAAADVGIAMGGTGTDAAMETADIVIIADKLKKLIHARQLSIATVRNMKQNMFFAVSVVVLLIAGVLTKNIYLESGMFIHELSVLLVILNALRLVRYNRDKKKSFDEGLHYRLGESN